MKSMLTIKHILIKSGHHEHGYFQEFLRSLSVDCLYKNGRRDRKTCNLNILSRSLRPFLLNCRQADYLRINLTYHGIVYISCLTRKGKGRCVLLYRWHGQKAVQPSPLPESPVAALPGPRPPHVRNASLLAPAFAHQEPAHLLPDGPALSPKS